MAEVRVSDRYVRSLFDFATSKSNLDKVYEDVQLIKNTIEASSDLKLLLRSPIIKSGKKQEVLGQIFKSKVSQETIDFLNLLCFKNRIDLLESIAVRFIVAYNESKGIQDATVVSAVALGESLLKDVKTKAEEVSGKKINLTQKVDSSLIGGYVLRIGDRQIDDSIKGKINNMRKATRLA
ncbi:MAG: ATP synthase F1 subunit delta [Cyclobacteriaceae bacterium]|nr:ATP synthase F1 subunit delta [Cyclobacteriaceae bacterium]MCH8515009.1 ATP synthase F1 subunit delta [Cyclobacteriaceae bacterium]